MKENNKPYTLDRVVRLVIALAVAIVLGLLVKRLSAVLLPFVIAWLLAYLIYPLVKFFQDKLHFKYRLPSVITSVALILGILIVGIWLLYRPMHTEIQRVGVLIDHFISQPDRLNLPAEWTAYLKSYLAGIDVEGLLSIENIEKVAKHLLPGAKSVLSASMSLLLNLTIVLFVLLYLVFILIDFEKLSSSWIELIPVKYRQFARGLYEDLEAGMNAYFRGQGLIALCVGILFAIGFRIIGLPMGITFGIFVGVLNLVPYMQSLSIPVAILLALIKAAEYNQDIWIVLLSVGIVYAVVQTFQDTVLTPRIMGNATGLKPAIILLSLSIFGSLFGILGMIIALPFTTLIISYYKRFVIAREPLDSPEKEAE